MRKSDIKRISKLEQRIPIFENMIKNNKVLNEEEKEVLTLSISYIIDVIVKHKGGLL